MTRYNRIKQMTREEIANMMCQLWFEHMPDELIDYESDISLCDYCPVQKTCHKGHIGYLDWLDGEWDEKYITG